MTFAIIPRLLFVCLVLCIYSLSIVAQTSETRPPLIKRTVKIFEPYNGAEKAAKVSEPKSEAKPEAEAKDAIPHVAEESRPGKSFLSSTPASLIKYQPLLSAAIDQRLGSPYHWGSTGPNSFDCSGFVWSTFHSVGIEFERGSARTLWARFEAPAAEDSMKFGTLVFFSGLTHVGIVVDEKGFYHASRHHGVVYAPFNKYWLAHIDGFRKVPLAAITPIVKPAASAPVVVEQ